jgi:hypothetical protein
MDVSPGFSAHFSALDMLALNNFVRFFPGLLLWRVKFGGGAVTLPE